VTGLGAFVADLASRAERSSVRSSALAGNVSLRNSTSETFFFSLPSSKSVTHQFTARVALHGLSLAVASKVVWSATLVAGRSTRISSETTTERSAKVSTGSIATAASTRAGTRGRTRSSALGVWGWAVALFKVSELLIRLLRQSFPGNLQPSGQAGHSYSTGRWQSHRSDAGLGSPPEHGLIPGSGSTA
jgi:hypothetical protein